MKKEQKYIPKSGKIKQWEFSRRSFIKGSLALATLSQLQLLASCTDGFIENNVLNKTQFKTLEIIQNILFPKGEFGSSAKDINAHLYIIWLLFDENMDKEDKKYALDGIKWVQETAQEQQSKDFLKLTFEEQKDLIKFISQTKWGENWLSYMMTIIVEAMVSDPVYGFNKESDGIDWLSHKYGLPRPSRATKYPEIFKTIANNE